jgi:hypothetical protein
LKRVHQERRWKRLLLSVFAVGSIREMKRKGLALSFGGLFVLLLVSTSVWVLVGFTQSTRSHVSRTGVITSEHATSPVMPRAEPAPPEQQSITDEPAEGVSSEHETLTRVSTGHSVDLLA